MDVIPRHLIPKEKKIGFGKDYLGFPYIQMGEDDSSRIIMGAISGNLDQIFKQIQTGLEGWQQKRLLRRISVHIRLKSREYKKVTYLLPSDLKHLGEGAIVKPKKPDQKQPIEIMTVRELGIPSYKIIIIPSLELSRDPEKVSKLLARELQPYVTMDPKTRAQLGLKTKREILDPLHLLYRQFRKEFLEAIESLRNAKQRELQEAEQAGNQEKLEELQGVVEGLREFKILGPVLPLSAVKKACEPGFLGYFWSENDELWFGNYGKGTQEFVSIGGHKTRLETSDLYDQKVSYEYRGEPPLSGLGFDEEGHPYFIHYVKNFTPPQETALGIFIHEDELTQVKSKKNFFVLVQRQEDRSAGQLSTAT